MLRLMRLDSIASAESENLSSEEIAAMLCDYLLELPVRGGERIFENQIAKQTGISRPQIREACRLLESQGMLSYTPNRGYSLRVLTEKEVKDLVDFRCIIEAAAFERVAAREDRSEVIESLKAVYEEISQALQEDNASRQIAADLAFHRKVVEWAGNDWLLQSFDRASTQMRYAIRIMSRQASDFGVYGKSHAVLIECLERGDVGEVRARIREHIMMFIPTLLKRIQD